MWLSNEFWCLWTITFGSLQKLPCWISDDAVRFGDKKELYKMAVKMQFFFVAETESKMPSQFIPSA